MNSFINEMSTPTAFNNSQVPYVKNQNLVGGPRTNTSTYDFRKPDNNFNQSGLSYHCINDKIPSKYLPVLPEIKNKDIENAVFTHKSFTQSQPQLNKTDTVSKNYERLEFFGDSTLNHLITRILFERFHNANEGELTKIRSYIVSNKNLAMWSVQYGFPERLRSTSVCTSDKKMTKVNADIFEAYIGGLFIDNNKDTAVIESWLKELSNPLIWKLSKDILKDEPNYQSQLFALIGTASFSPSYVSTHLGYGQYSTQCYMGYEIISKGSGYSVQESETNAAKHALESKKIINQYRLAKFISVNGYHGNVTEILSQVNNLTFDGDATSIAGFNRRLQPSEETSLTEICASNSNTGFMKLSTINGPVQDTSLKQIPTKPKRCRLANKPKHVVINKIEKKKLKTKTKTKNNSKNKTKLQIQLESKKLKTSVVNKSLQFPSTTKSLAKGLLPIKSGLLSWPSKNTNGTYKADTVLRGTDISFPLIVTAPDVIDTNSKKKLMCLTSCKNKPSLQYSYGVSSNGSHLASISYKDTTMVKASGSDKVEASLIAAMFLLKNLYLIDIVYKNNKKQSKTV